VSGDATNSEAPSSVGIPKLLCAVTAAASTGFYRGRLAYLRQHGFEVHLASAPGAALEATGQSDGVATHTLPLKRGVSPLADLACLFRAWQLIRRLKPDIVDGGTLKGGLLLGLASAAAGVRCRVYSMYGLRLETTRGLLRRVLALSGWVACACAHKVLCISPSLKRRAIELGLTRPDKLVVIGSGSVKGITVERFALSPEVRQRTERLRQELHIPAGAPVVGFVGRLVRDKGVRELVDAWERLRPRFPTLTLLLVGPFEEGDPVDVETRQRIESTPGIVAPGPVDDVVPYFHLMDVFALPTYREGFGEVSLEAAAAGKPVVTTTATGAQDAVVDGVTGFTVPVGNAAALADAVGRLLENPESARQMGEAGRQRAIAEFQPERIFGEIEELYRGLLKRRAGNR
jgi:glycosyltransferase involved in cell wall biosynthesis